MEERKIKLLNFVKEYYKMFIAIGSTLFIIVFYIMKFFEYLTAKAYFSYFKINFELYRFNDQGFIYSLFISLMFILLLISNIVITHDLIKLFKNCINFRNIKNILKKIIILLISNAIFCYAYLGYYNLYSFIFSNIGLIILEIVILFNLSKSDKELTKEDLNKSLKDYFVYLPFLIIFLMLTYTIKTGLKIGMNRTYDVIGDDKVVVYSNNDYYVTLDCEIKENILIIYRGKQEKIDNNNVHTESRTFEKIDFK